MQKFKRARIGRQIGRGIVAAFVTFGVVPRIQAAGNGTLVFAVVRDWGIHREWRIERDRTHPERPPRLVEIAWTDRAKEDPRACQVISPSGNFQKSAASVSAPEVRAGTRVKLWRSDGEAAIFLTGTALESGREGDVIRVQAGLRGTVLR